MARQNSGKTETIKERSIYVYLPSIEMMEDWKARAEKAGSSISKFVTDRVEDSLKKEEGEEEGYLSRIELIKKQRQMEDENRKLSEENRETTPEHCVRPGSVNEDVGHSGAHLLVEVEPHRQQLPQLVPL
jgi:hypothetical protein